MDLFDKFMGSARDASKVITQKAKDFTETTKLNSQIAAEENRIKEAYFAIGKRYYEESSGEVTEDYMRDFDLINESKARIQEFSEQLIKLKGTLNCQKCGAEVALEDSFCRSCGSKIEHPEPPKAQENGQAEENEQAEESDEDSQDFSEEVTEKDDPFNEE